MVMINFGCNVGDTLYVASEEYKKICMFKVDCLKYFGHNITAHGEIYGICNGISGLPTEFSLKNLNKRVIFTERKEAKKWLKERISE